MKTCHFCQMPVADNWVECRHCGIALQHSSSAASRLTTDDAPFPGQLAIGVLRLLAWLNLIACVSAALLVSPTDRLPDSLRWLLVTSLVGSGVVGCAFLLVICDIADNVIGIRRQLMQLLPADSQSTAGGEQVSSCVPEV